MVVASDAGHAPRAPSPEQMTIITRAYMEVKFTRANGKTLLVTEIHP